MASRTWLFSWAATMTLACGTAMAGGGAPQMVSHSTPLIPRTVLFGNPDRASPQISPDGTQLAFLAERDGVLNVFVAPINEPGNAKPVTEDKKRGIRQYFWAYTNQHIIYLQDQGGNENWRIYVVDLASGTTRDLTPMDGVAARVEEVSEQFPDEILVGINNRNPQLHDIHRVNIRTGQMALVEENTGFIGYLTDDTYRVRFATRFGPDGGMEVLRNTGKPGEKSVWESFDRIPMEDANTTSALGFDKSGDVMFALESRGRNTAALIAHNLVTGEKKTLAEDPKADINGVMANPVTKEIEAAASTFKKRTWQFLDKSVEADVSYLQTLGEGEVNIVSRTLDDRTWIVGIATDTGPVRFFRYERGSRNAQFLFTNRKNIENLELAAMKPLVIKSRDGLDLVSYLTLPVGTDKDKNGVPDAGAVPMVLLVHGGPWARDGWGYNSLHQMLANRGYAVLSVNFRGSTGFGKNFLNAGDREWAGKMHDDLIDAVNWAVQERIADKDRVAIMGGSYGGYAALVGLTFTPDVFAAGVSIVGPSNIATLLSTVPPYWQPMVQMFKNRVGDWTSAEGKEFLASRSPLTFVDRIQRPLLIGQGANDPRVKQSESDQIVEAMQKKSIPVTYVLFPDEGHGFARPENNMAFMGIAEAFLSRHLGGRFEPLGETVSKSTAKVVTGADGVPGLSESGGPR